MSAWLKTRRLGRYQQECWPLAMHLDHLYTLLRITKDFRAGLQAVKR